MTQLPDALLAGYRTFKAGKFADQHKRYQALAESGQAPEVLVIACCDSRAVPEMIFDAAPGELFVLRNVANLVPPYRPDGEYHGTSAALEYAVQSLKVKHIVVLGHGRCGGIRAALNPGATPLSSGDFIGRWIDLLRPVMDDLPAPDGSNEAARHTALERLSVKQTLDNLRTFPCVQILEGKGRLSLHGAWFDISEGELWLHDGAEGGFHLLDA